MTLPKKKRRAKAKRKSVTQPGDSETAPATPQKELPVTVIQADVLTDAVADKIAKGRDNLSDEGIVQLETTLKSQREQLRVYESVYAASRVARMQLLGDYMEEVEKILFPAGEMKTRLRMADTRELIALMKVLNDERKDNLDYIHAVANQESILAMLPLIFPKGSDQAATPDRDLVVEERRKVREIMGRLSRKLQLAKNASQKEK